MVRITSLWSAAAGFLAVLVLATPLRAQFTLSDAPLWTAPADSASYPFLNPGVPSPDTRNQARGFAYNPATGNLLVASRFGGLGVYTLNGRTGEVQNGGASFNVSGVSGGIFPASLIGVGGDGAIYLANLTLNSGSSPFKLYRWASEAAAASTAPTLVYSGNPSPAGVTVAGRFGDSLDVIGSGANTRVLAGNRNGFNATDSSVAILSPTDATFATFAAQGVTTGVPNGHLGIAWQDDRTYWTKNNNTANSTLGTPDTRALLRQVTISGDPPAGSITSTLSSAPLTSSAVGVNDALDLLGLVEYSTGTGAQNVHLYDITDPANVALLATRSAVTTATSNPNGNGIGVVDFGNPGGTGDVLYAMSVNNGIVAYSVVVPEPTALGIALPAALLLAARRSRRPGAR